MEKKAEEIGEFLFVWKTHIKELFKSGKVRNERRILIDKVGEEMEE